MYLYGVAWLWQWDDHLERRLGLARSAVAWIRSQTPIFFGGVEDFYGYFLQLRFLSCIFGVSILSFLLVLNFW